MAFDPKPGSFSLFHNDRKNTDNHPDYTGQGALPDGTPCWISAWKKSANGKNFLSISVKPKDGATGNAVEEDFLGGGGGSGGQGGDPVGAGRGRGHPRESFNPDLDDEIPFASPWGMR